MSETSDCLLRSCLCLKKLINNKTSETYCVRHCCQDTPKRAVHAEGGAVSIKNTDVKSEDTEITDTRNHRQGLRCDDSDVVRSLCTHTLGVDVD